MGPLFDPSMLERLAAQARSHGDAELVRDLVREAIKSIVECTTALEVALGAEDHGAMRAHAHRVKSVLRQVGALRMADAAARCESLAASAHPSAGSAARDVLALRDASLDALRAHLEKIQG